MYERDYVHTRRLEGAGFAAVVARTRVALAAGGFGVITEIDVQATMRAKLGIERRPFLILGACNPALAHQALTAEPAIGTLLPCNVDVFEADDGAIYVQTVRPTVLFGLVKNPAVQPLAEEIDARLQRVLAAV